MPSPAAPLPPMVSVVDDLRPRVSSRPSSLPAPSVLVSQLRDHTTHLVAARFIPPLFPVSPHAHHSATSQHLSRHFSFLASHGLRFAASLILTDKEVRSFVSSFTAFHTTGPSDICTFAPCLVAPPMQSPIPARCPCPHSHNTALPEGALGLQIWQMTTALGKAVAKEKHTGRYPRQCPRLTRASGRLARPALLRASDLSVSFGGR